MSFDSHLGSIPHIKIHPRLDLESTGYHAFNKKKATPTLKVQFSMNFSIYLATEPKNPQKEVLDI